MRFKKFIRGILGSMNWAKFERFSRSAIRIRTGRDSTMLNKEARELNQVKFGRKLEEFCSKIVYKILKNFGRDADFFR